MKLTPRYENSGVLVVKESINLTFNTHIMEVLQGKQTTKDYPYGRLRCTRSLWIEFKSKRGFRAVSQTINPKTHRLNNPKNSTYSTFTFLFKEEETGFTRIGGFSLNGMESVSKFQQWLIENKDYSFTEEESQYLWAIIIATSKIQALYRKEAVAWLEAMNIKELIQSYGAKKSIQELTEITLDMDLEATFEKTY